MKYLQFFEALFQKRVSGIKPGLSRMKRAYEIMGQPARSIPTIIIGGTNGKGSTAGLVWGLLARAGCSVGLYTSPHLLHFRERYQLSHAEIDDQALVAELEALKAKLPAELYDELSFFEIATLLALSLFSRHQCQFIILEVGLGGRWDATNIVEPIASVVVSVSRDHEAYLGHDLLSIGREKLGIARAGRPLFWGMSGEIMAEKPALDGFYRELEEIGGQLLTRPGSFERCGELIHLRLPGEESCQLEMPSRLQCQAAFLQDNFVIALAVYHWLAGRYLPLLPSSKEVLELISQRGLACGVSMVARFQRLAVSFEGQSYDLLLDVCHNPDGLRVLKDSLKQKGWQGLPMLVSILRDKKVDEMLDGLRDLQGELILFQLDDERSLRPADLAERHRDLACFESFSKAWQHACKVWHNHKKPWLICGSVLAVGQVLGTLNVQPLKVADETL